MKKVKKKWAVTFHVYANGINRDIAQASTTMFFETFNVGKELEEEIVKMGDDWVEDMHNDHPNCGLHGESPVINMLQCLGPVK